jgi:hypothetical protein
LSAQQPGHFNRAAAFSAEPRRNFIETRPFSPPLAPPLRRFSFSNLKTGHEEIISAPFLLRFLVPNRSRTEH